MPVTVAEFRVPAPNTRVQRTPLSPLAHRSPLTRCPLGDGDLQFALAPTRGVRLKDGFRCVRAQIRRN